MGKSKLSSQYWTIKDFLYTFGFLFLHASCLLADSPDIISISPNSVCVGKTGNQETPIHFGKRNRFFFL
jgi:hypothetical protein